MNGHLEKHLAELASIQVEEILRTDLPNGGFGRFCQQFEAMVQIASALSGLDLSVLPQSTRQNLEQHAGKLVNAVSTIRDLHERQSDLQQSWNHLQNRHLPEELDGFINTGIGFVLFQYLRGDPARRIQEVSQEAEVLAGEIRETRKRIDLEWASRALSDHARVFHDESRTHAKAAWWALAATVVVGILTAGFALFSGYWALAHMAGLKATQAIQVGLAKLLIFSVLYFALVWSARIYRAHRHNAVVNRHRKNAISSFESFVRAASDERTLDAVLLQATEAVYSAQVTGFLGGEQEVGSTKVFEVFRSFGEPQPGQ